MKGKIRNTVWIMLLVILCGCQEETFDNKQTMDENVLTLTLATQPASRADPDGDDRFNENKIERADIYFFEVNTSAQEAQRCIYAQTGLSADASNIVRVPLDRTVLTGSTYYVYAVANHDFGYTSETAVNSNVTIAQLKAQTISTNWKEGYTEGETVIEQSLVMDGSKEITFQNPQTTAEEIKMTRAMAKVMLYASTETEIEVEGVKYIPIQNGMNVTMVYGVNKTNLADTYTINASNDYITRMKRDYTTNTISGEDGKVLYEQEAPFYSYPNPENATDRQDSYLILCVPWQITTSEGPSYQAQDYYYRIPITGDNSSALLERNHYYRIKVNIGVLGSLNPRDAVELTGEFEIMDWYDMNIDVNMQNYRYLVLDEYNSVMNNVDELEMPYISSSDIAWEDNPDPDGNYTRITSVSYWDYHNNDSYEVILTPDYPYDEDNRWNHPVEFSDFKLEPGSEGTLLISHPLNDDDDFVPYTITGEVYNTQGVHTDTWTITQYPAMYIVGEKNDNGNTNRFVNGYYNHNNRDSYEDAYDDRHTDLGGVKNLNVDGGTNNNPNQYTIYITSFDIGDQYAIGDPRIETPINFGDRLDVQTYKHAREEGVETMVTPAFKIASSWAGVSGSLSFDEAQRRCASYQENGYPAGRWRIPTEAEILYVVELSEDDKIPQLFSGNYWASSRRLYTTNGNWVNSAGTQRVRCVYDVWYWGDKKIDETSTEFERTDFVWGDSEDGTLRSGTKH